MGRNKKVKVKRRGDPQVASCRDGDGTVHRSSSSLSSTGVDATAGDGADGVGHASSEIVGFGLDGERHPLLNSLVLANLLRYCPDQKELSGWRLVCQTWWEESLLRWRSNATIKLICRDPSSDPFNSIYVGRNELDNEDEPDPDVEGEQPITPLSQFLTFLEGEGKVKPFRQFHLEGWSFAPPAVRKLLGNGGGKLDRFWSCVGANLTSLTLSGCNFASGNLFGKLIFKSSPNLRSLTLTGKNTYSGYKVFRTVNLAEELRLVRQQTAEPPLFGENRKLKSVTVDMNDHHPFPMTWLQFLCHVPCLEALKLVYAHAHSNGIDIYSTPHHVKEVLIVIDMIREQDGGKLPIKEFDIVNGPIAYPITINLATRNDDSRHYLDMFARLQLPLRHLNISLDPGLEFKQNQLKEVLQSYSSQLKRIDGWRTYFDFIEPTQRPLCNFPFGIQLDNLEQLAIAQLFCPNFQFLKQAPNLRKLEIVMGRHFEEGPPPFTSLVANTCELEFAEVRLPKLKTLCLGYKVKDKELRRLTNWFPHLEELTMPLNNSQLSIVCEYWRGLRHLHVIGGELNDVGVTGNSGRQKSTKPSITLLENLRCFEIERTKSALSDRSAFHGFLKLPNLRRLGLTSDSNDFGLEASEALKNRIPRCYLKVECGGFGSHNPFSMFSCKRYWEYWGWDD